MQMESDMEIKNKTKRCEDSLEEERNKIRKEMATSEKKWREHVLEFSFKSTFASNYVFHIQILHVSERKGWHFLKCCIVVALFPRNLPAKARKVEPIFKEHIIVSCELGAGKKKKKPTKYKTKTFICAHKCIGRQQ